MRALLCDLDGTLVDSTAAVERVWGRWFDAHGIARPARHPHGIPARQVIAELAPDLDLDAATAELTALEVADRGGVVALPGAAELLAAAADGRLRVAVAIVTSCSTDLAAVRLEAGGLAAPDVLVVSDDTARGKPDPAPYLLGARRLGVPPADCLVVEDAPAGVRAGIAAGARVAALRTTHDDAELADAHEHHDDVAALLGAHALVA